MSTLGGDTTRQENDASIPSDMQALAAAMGLDLPARVLVQVSQFHLRDFLKPNFKELQTAIELTLFPLVARLDMPVHDFLLDADMQPFFALSWIITWFSHEVRDTELVKRLFDVFIVSHPLMPIYLSVAMVLHTVNRQDILGADHDFGTVHQTLRDLPKNSSMTGWKYRPGDGYVSDDEAEDEDDTLEQAGIAGDFEKIQSELVSEDRQDPNTTQSSVSTCAGSVLEGQTRVPFQELIDLALDFMRRVPPHKLLPLAVRYYGGPHVATLLAPSQNIRLFSNPPDFAVRSYAEADQILQQRELREGSASVGKDDKDIVEKEPLKAALSRMKASRATVALGFSEGEDKGRRRKRRNHIIIGAIGVAALAVAVGVLMNKFSSKEESAGDRGLPGIVQIVREDPLPPQQETALKVDIAAHADRPAKMERRTSDPVFRSIFLSSQDSHLDTWDESLLSACSPMEDSNYQPSQKESSHTERLAPEERDLEASETNTKGNRMALHLAKIFRSPVVRKKLVQLGDGATRLWTKVADDDLSQYEGQERSPATKNRDKIIAHMGKILKSKSLRKVLVQLGDKASRLWSKLSSAERRALGGATRAVEAVFSHFRERFEQIIEIVKQQAQVGTRAVRTAGHTIFHKDGDLRGRIALQISGVRHSLGRFSREGISVFDWLQEEVDVWSMSPKRKM